MGTSYGHEVVQPNTKYREKVASWKGMAKLRPIGRHQPQELWSSPLQTETRGKWGVRQCRGYKGADPILLNYGLLASHSGVQYRQIPYLLGSLTRPKYAYHKPLKYQGMTDGMIDVYAKHPRETEMLYHPLPHPHHGPAMGSKWELLSPPAPNVMPPFSNCMGCVALVCEAPKHNFPCSQGTYCT